MPQSSSETELHERDEQIVARMVYQAAEAGIESFVFAGIKAEKDQTLLHIQNMNFNGAFNAAITVVRHVLKVHIDGGAAWSEEYRGFFETFRAKLDHSVLQLSENIQAMNKKQAAKVAAKKK